MVGIERNLKIGIVGLGMVGGPLRVWFEDYHFFKRGVNLFCYDADPKKGFGDDYNWADIVFIALPTPANQDGSCDVSIVQNVIASLSGKKIVVIKSTVPPGTTENFQKKFPNHTILFNPEFLTEANARADFLKPIRQIVGYTAKSKSAHSAMRVLALLPKSDYESPLIVSEAIIGLTATEAEMVKYASNVFGAMKVGFSNMICDVCYSMKENCGLNVNYGSVRQALGADPRIGLSWADVNHGSYRGFGGYCFPKDLKAFIYFIREMSLGSSGKIMRRLIATQSFFSDLWNYNVRLLKHQNLSVADVSVHDKDIILSKVKNADD